MEKRDEGTAKFIKLVQSNPILYTSTKKHEYRKERQKIWMEIAKEMGNTVTTVRTRWKGLLAGYTRYRRWVLHRDPRVNKHKNWVWAKKLAFLETNRKQFNKKKNDESINSFLRLDIPPTDARKDKVEEFNIKTEIDGQIDGNETAAGSSPSSYRSQTRTSLKDPLSTEENYENLNQSQSESNFIQNKRLKGIDAVDCLFMSYATTFKKFSVTTQASLKVKLATIFAEAECLECGEINNE